VGSELIARSASCWSQELDGKDFPQCVVHGVESGRGRIGG
jgi:hypothetical protein